MASQDSFFSATSVRLLAWYVAVFGVSVAILLFVVYWITCAALDQQLADSVERETQVLVGIYQRNDRDVDRLARAIHLRVADLRPPRRYYLLQDPAGGYIAGNLPALSPVEGRMVLPMPSLRDGTAKSDDPTDAYPVLAQGRRLENGVFLVVGESQFRGAKAREAILWALGWGIVITVLLAAGGGAALGAGFLRRIEAVNRTTRSIMDGNLSQRVPTRGGVDDEMDQLAVNLNAMLDRIQGLMESVKRVSDDIAHDLRTPLGRLRQRLEAAREQVGADAEPVIEQCLTELDAILGTFAALLRIAQIESGARRGAFADVSLAPIVNAISDAYAPVAEDRSQHIKTALEGAPRTHGDRELLTQMLANLIENPIRHCPGGTAITIGLRQEAGKAVLWVADTGPGIPVAERENVFRRLYRLEASRTTPGSGLGLALVKAIADLHGASITLSDNQPGLRVTIRFPAPDEKTARAHPSREAQRAPLAALPKHSG